MGQPERVGQSYRRVTASLRSIAGPDASDCVQEAFARAIKTGVPVEAEPWIRTVAKRVALDKVRRRHEYASGAPVELEGLIHDHDGDPQEAFVRAERSAEVRKALEGLPPRYRDALLTYAEEDSPAAVASRLGLSANAAWTLLSRARSRLRLQLEQVGYAPVAFLTRVRWRGLAIGGAAAGVAAAIAVSPLVPHASKVEPKHAPPAIVHVADPAKSFSAHPSALPDPVTGLAKVPVTVPKVDPPALPDAPDPQAVVSACIGVPTVGKIAGVQLSVPKPDKDSLLGAVTTKLPLASPVASIGSRLCK